MIYAPRDQSGFTMIELLVATTLLTLLSLAAVPFLIEKTNTSNADVVVGEVYSVGSAAQLYRSKNSAWPDQAANCAGAIPILTAAGFLPTFLTDASGKPVDSWGGQLVTSCGASAPFIVKANPQPGDTKNLKYAQYAASKLFAATVDPVVQSVSSSFVIPGDEPALDALLHRFSTPGRPELNQMATAIDMNNNAVNNASTVSWANGESLLNSDNGSGTIEFGSGQTTTHGHYVDFHYVAGEDYNVRLANGASGATSGIVKDGGFGILAREVVLGGVDASRGLAYPGDLTTFGGIDVCNPLAISSYAATTSASEGASRGCHLQANSGFFESKANDRAFSAPVGNYYVGSQGGKFQSDQGGSLELGADNTHPGTGSPYIDFHYNGVTSDYSTRVINDLDGRLSLVATVTRAATDLQVDGNEVVAGKVAATDFIGSVTKRSLAQSVSDAAIIDAADTPANRTITKPTCPAGLVPAIFTAVSQAAQGQNAYAIHQVRTYAVDNGGSWTVNMDLLTEDGTSPVAPVQLGYARALALWKCE